MVVPTAGDELDVPIPPTELLEAITSGRCIVFVGAGLSRGAGLPGWSDLINKLKDKAVDRNVLNITDIQELDKIINQGDLLTAAQVLQDKLGRRYFCGFMRRVFLKPGITPTDVHKQLKTIPFRAAVTTNFDNLLEQLYKDDSPNFGALTHKNVAELARAKRSADFFLFHLHGLASRCDSIVLSENDYRLLIHREPVYRDFVKFVLSTHTILFLGFSLNDPDIKYLLDELQSTSKKEVEDVDWV
jgi:hypothetical protein